jgi:uncharacterized protein (TIGR00369 family)
MNEQEIVNRFNSLAPQFITMLGGSTTAIDITNQACTMEFDVSTDFCHSVDIVQGGFITSMLDAAMSQSAFISDEAVVNVSSLEIKTNFLDATRAGYLRAVGRVVKAGYKVAFLEGCLYDESGHLTATSSSVAKLTRESKVAG